jgi:hypothetical protein
MGGCLTKHWYAGCLVGTLHHPAPRRQGKPASIRQSHHHQSDVVAGRIGVGIITRVAVVDIPDLD